MVCRKLLLVYVSFNECEFPIKETTTSSEPHTKSRLVKEALIEVEFPIASDYPQEPQSKQHELITDTTQEQHSRQYYQLARYRQRRQIKPPHKFGYADLVSYALIVATEINEDEHLSYKEAMNSKEKSNGL